MCVRACPLQPSTFFLLSGLLPTPPTPLKNQLHVLLSEELTEIWGSGCFLNCQSFAKGAVSMWCTGARFSQNAYDKTLRLEESRDAGFAIRALMAAAKFLYHDLSVPEAAPLPCMLSPPASSLLDRLVM